MISQHALSQSDRKHLHDEQLQQKTVELTQAEIEAQMCEGYKTTRQARAELNEEWQIVDGEGWPAEVETPGGDAQTRWCFAPALRKNGLNTGYPVLTG